MKRLIPASAFALAATLAIAQPGPDAPGPGGWGMGPGMMVGHGPGYGPGYGYGPGHGPGYGRGHGPGQGPGWGMGPGMRGGYGPGYGMNPDAMGGHDPGWGMGPGSWGMGMGMGMGMMGPGRAMWLPDLSDEQRADLVKLQDEARRRQWEIAGKMHDEMAAMRAAMATPDKRDRAAALAAFDRMSALRRQGLELSLDMADRLDQVLTPDQRQRLRRWGPWSR